ncbi:MAG: hypothetical protein GYA36_10935 [Veillonellaceae bacterium]|jgi:hypothetical protein|nr:hypothetical protein [Veillonellaceae bacterium]
MKIKWHKRILSALLLGSLAASLTVVGLVQAAPPAPDSGPDAAQADRPPQPGDPAKRLHEMVTKLVEKKVIDTDQAHRVMLFFQQKDAERRAEWDKVKSMAPGERDSYMEQQCIQRCKKRPDLVKDLMEGTGLSKEQAQALAQEMRPPHGPGRAPGPEGQNPPPAPPSTP